jgi:hypothetical protein
MKRLGLLLILTSAFMLRIVSPTLFHEPGNDIPLHIAVPIHLDQVWAERGITGLIGQSLRYVHGYSTINTLHLLYGAAFTLAGMPITPVSMAGVHALIGMTSLLTLFLFLNRVVARRDALLMTLLASLAPIHVGMSAANAGYQVFMMTALFLTFWRLYAWCETPTPFNRLIYGLTLSFAIGASSDFFIIPALNLLLARWLLKTPVCAEAARQRLWSHGWLWVFCWLPCLVVLGFAVYTRLLGEHVGVLNHLNTVASSLSTPTFTPLLTLKNLLINVGPLAVVSPIAIVVLLRRSSAPWERILMVYWILMFITISCSSRAGWTAHILSLGTPSLILTYRLLEPLRWGRVMLVLGGLASLILTALIIFRAGDLPLRKTYGSRSPRETGVEALGQVIRSRQLPVIQDPHSNKLALVVDFEGAWFYLGADTEGPDFLSSGTPPASETLYVVRPGVQSRFNLAIADRVRGWPLLLEIRDGDRVVMQVFNSQGKPRLGSRNAAALRDEFWSTYHRTGDFAFSFLGN